MPFVSSCLFCTDEFCFLFDIDYISYLKKRILIKFLRVSIMDLKATEVLNIYCDRVYPSRRQVLEYFEKHSNRSLPTLFKQARTIIGDKNSPCPLIESLLISKKAQVDITNLLNQCMEIVSEFVKAMDEDDAETAKEKFAVISESCTVLTIAYKLFKSSCEEDLFSKKIYLCFSTCLGIVGRIYPNKEQYYEDDDSYERIAATECREKILYSKFMLGRWSDPQGEDQKPQSSFGSVISKVYDFLSRLTF